MQKPPLVLGNIHVFLFPFFSLWTPLWLRLGIRRSPLVFWGCPLGDYAPMSGLLGLGLIWICLNLVFVYLRTLLFKSCFGCRVYTVGDRVSWWVHYDVVSLSCLCQWHLFGDPRAGLQCSRQTVLCRRGVLVPVHVFLIMPWLVQKRDYRNPNNRLGRN